MPTLEFNGQPICYMLEYEGELKFHVEGLVKMSKPVEDNHRLPLWKGVVVGNMLFAEEYSLIGVAYSPYVLGKELDLNIWDDCTQLYGAVFEYLIEYGFDGPDLKDRVRKHHSQFCQWDVDTLFEAWEACQQHAAIAQHLEPSSKSNSVKKI